MPMAFPKLGDCVPDVTTPSLGKAIGMGYVATTNAAVDSIVMIQVRDKQLKAKVVKVPFN